MDEEKEKEDGRKKRGIDLAQGREEVGVQDNGRRRKVVGDETRHLDKAISLPKKEEGGGDRWKVHHPFSFSTWRERRKRTRESPPPLQVCVHRRRRIIQKGLNQKSLSINYA